MSIIIGLFKLIVFLGVIAAIYIAVSYNRLQRAAQNVKEKGSNVQIAISKKISEINQLVTMVKSYQEFEQFTQLKVSGDAGAAGMTAAYEQSNTALLAIQAAAQRFPDLKANTQYGRMIDSIQNCETNIQENRMRYNNAVKEYNGICLAIPTVFFSRIIGFPPAPYLEFDTSGLQQDGSMREFKTDDGERLNSLLGQAGSALASASRNLVLRASDIGNNALGSDKEPRMLQSASLICSGCGGSIDAMDKFCKNCGKPHAQ